MKKRSLFAAVAMLIVSAVVLTSATYAWFNAQAGTASVSKSAVGIARSSESRLQVADANGSNWGNSYSPGAGTSNLTPVDINPAINGNGPLTCTYDGITFSGIQAPSGTPIYTYSWRVRAVSGYEGKRIAIPYAWSNGEGSTNKAIFGAVRVNGGSWEICGPGAYNYLNTVTSATESTVNGIVDDGEFDTAGGTKALTAISVDGTKDSGTLYIDSDVVAAGATGTRMGTLVEVMLWAEGQYAGCAGSVSLSGAGFTFSEIALVS